MEKTEDELRSEQCTYIAWNEVFIWSLWFSATEFVENTADDLRSELWNHILWIEGFILSVWFSATEFVENTAENWEVSSKFHSANGRLYLEREIQYDCFREN
jgi:hypothetical protein